MSRVVVFKEFSDHAKAISQRILFPLKPGDLILRPVTFYETWNERMGKVVFPQVLSPKFRSNDRGQQVIRVQKWGDNYVAQSSHKKHGIVAFCSFPIDDLWTHFEVTSIAVNGKCAFVKPVCGSEGELIARFKR